MREMNTLRQNKRTEGDQAGKERKAGLEKRTGLEKKGSLPRRETALEKKHGEEEDGKNGTGKKRLGK